jgi:glycosyltransferase involved in cell wall biosynthesis
VLESLSLPITVLLAVKDEAVNLPRCLAALGPARKVYVIDSHSKDDTARIASEAGAEVVQFDYPGGYPKKRQWALDHLPIDTPWIFLLDADEVVPEPLWREIASAIAAPDARDAYLIEKGFHFLGRRFRFGGFSHSAVLLLRTGKGRFEQLFDDGRQGLDMEVHERIAVEGTVGRLVTPLIHEDFKGLEAYIDRHNRYSTWEARVRHQYLTRGVYGQIAIRARLFGNSQERRRFIKSLMVRFPCEHWLWFLYHYAICLGVLEGRRGLIASQIRSSYIAQVRAKMHELRLLDQATGRS